MSPSQSTEPGAVNRGARMKKVTPAGGSPKAAPPAPRPKVRVLPPMGVDDNEGEWITEKFHGACTCCLCVVFWPAACCPVDSRRIYVTSRGVRHERDGRKIPAHDGWHAPASILVGLVATLALCWALVHKCSTFEICTDWCKSEAMFSIANDPSNAGADFIQRWGDDVDGLKRAIQAEGLFETLGGPAQGRLELESVDVERLVDTATNVDVFVVSTLFQTPWGPPELGMRALAEAGWSVYASFAGELDREVCEDQRQRFLAAANSTNSTDGQALPAAQLELAVAPASRSWLLQCDHERVDAWFEAATAHAKLGSSPPSQGKYPSYARGLCVFGSFSDGDMQCTSMR